MALRPELQSIFDAIMVAHPDGLTLNELSEELLTKALSYADIDELIGALEDAGVNLDGPETSPPPDDLRRVIEAARALTGATGNRPSAEEIAERTGLTAAAVRRALRYGRSLG